MDKSLSVTSMASLTSDQLEDETLVVDDDEEYDEAPYDVMGEHESVGNIIVAKRGEILPKTTKYKRKDSTSIPVKFHVTKKLEVSSVEFVPKGAVEKTVAISLDTSPTVVQAQRPSTTASLSSNLLFSVSTPITSKNPPGVSGNKRQCQGTALSSRLTFDDHLTSALSTTDHSSIEEVELAGNVEEEPVPTEPTNHVQKSSFMGESDFVKILSSLKSKSLAVWRLAFAHLSENVEEYSSPP